MTVDLRSFLSDEGGNRVRRKAPGVFCEVQQNFERGWFWEGGRRKLLRMRSCVSPPAPHRPPLNFLELLEECYHVTKVRGRREAMSDE